MKMVTDLIATLPRCVIAVCKFGFDCRFRFSLDQRRAVEHFLAEKIVTELHNWMSVREERLLPCGPARVQQAVDCIFS